MMMLVAGVWLSFLASGTDAASCSHTISVGTIPNGDNACINSHHDYVCGTTPFTETVTVEAGYPVTVISDSDPLYTHSSGVSGDDCTHNGTGNPRVAVVVCSC